MHRETRDAANTPPSAAEETVRVSVVVPVFNESESISSLFDEILATFRSSEYDFEIIFVNDGSTDGSGELLHALGQAHPQVRVVEFSTNFGQTAALRAGIDHATGDIIVPMDSDLENDPADIPKLIKELSKGYDVVSGWRSDRWRNKPLTRRVPSTVANLFISQLTGLRLHDYGCTLKAYRSEVLKGTLLYGEMHRFIPAYTMWRGGKVTELPVNHRPRRYGKSNYGITRTFRVLLDLLLLRFLHRYMNRPIHFFGMVGFVSLGLALLSGVSAIGLRLFASISLISTPLPVLTTLLIIVGVQFVGMGIIAEMLMRVYYESQSKTPYHIRRTTNLGE